MPVEEIIRLEWLARELKSLIGYGAKPNHVILRPTLRDLVWLAYPEIDLKDLGVVIVHQLGEATDELPEDKREAVRYLLNLYEKNLSALNRRLSALVHLGGGYSVETWRRPDGPELDVMRDLARLLVRRLSPA
jgi:hypothetical protein